MAEDITSAVFLKVVERFSRFKGTEPQFRNWLYKIATNAIADYLRKSARRNDLIKAAYRRTDSGVVDCEAPADEADKKLALLRDAVFTLKPRYQTIIALRFFENMKLTEIASVLGKSSGTVRSQLARALARLQKRINELATEKFD
jgi:RNA polymerase sigma-70 factor (ECF subfamily)